MEKPATRIVEAATVIPTMIRPRMTDHLLGEDDELG